MIIYYKYLVWRWYGNQLKEKEISRNGGAGRVKWEEEGTEKRMEIEQLSPS